MKKINKLSTRELAIAAGLAAISAVAQLAHIGYQSPQFGMWIDIVAVSWLIALFLFGLRMASIVTLIGALVITLFAPDTWLGASMKWLATLPIWLILGVWARNHNSPFNYFRSFKHLFIPLVLSILIRCLIIIPVNYYYAIPIWTGMDPVASMAVIPWYIIAIFNILQSIVDVILAWLLVYKFKLDRYASKI